MRSDFNSWTKTVRCFSEREKIGKRIDTISARRQSPFFCHKDPTDSSPRPSRRKQHWSIFQSIASSPVSWSKREVRKARKRNGRNRRRGCERRLAARVVEEFRDGCEEGEYLHASNEPLAASTLEDETERDTLEATRKGREPSWYQRLPDAITSRVYAV